MTIYKYFADISKEELRNSIVVPSLNDSGFRTILIKNSAPKKMQATHTTKYLNIKNNAVLEFDGNEYYFHIISCKSSSEFINRNFDVIYEYLFKKIGMPINEYEFSELLSSIEELFAKFPGDLNTIQIGMAGELLTLINLYDAGYENIVNDYHKNNVSKHDFEVTSKLKIEVKTTVKPNRIHAFSHNQLTGLDLSVIVSSVKLQLLENGTSLYQLFMMVLSRVTSFESAFLFRKLMNFCDVDPNNQGISVPLDYSLDNIWYILSKNVPQLVEEIPNGVTNISYESVCDLCETIDIKDLIDLIRVL